MHYYFQFTTGRPLFPYFLPKTSLFRKLLKLANLKPIWIQFQSSKFYKISNTHQDQIVMGIEFTENSPLKVIFSISLKHVSPQFYVVNSRSHLIHKISAISHEITQKLTNFSLQITKNGENRASRISRFMQMLRSENTFTFDSRKFCPKFARFRNILFFRLINNSWKNTIALCPG